MLYKACIEITPFNCTVQLQEAYLQFAFVFTHLAESDTYIKTAEAKGTIDLDLHVIQLSQYVSKEATKCFCSLYLFFIFFKDAI